MSRSGYSDDCENMALYRGTVESAFHGRRGQRFLRELLAALDAMPNKRLIAHELVTPDGDCCALGAVAVARGQDVSDLEPHEPNEVGDAFGIAWQMAAEIEYMNDEDSLPSEETPEERYSRMRAWVARNIVVQPDEVIDAVPEDT